MSAPLRVGLVGAGRIVREGHLPAYLASTSFLNVVAVADPDASRAAEVAGPLGIPAGHQYPGHAELLDEPGLDLVVVASPSHTHHGAVVAALGRGVGVICEKPLCVDQAGLASVRAEADRAAARGAGGFVAVLHNYLAKPGWRQLIALIREGRIGEPRLARFEELSRDHWRSVGATGSSWREYAEYGGGPLQDNLYHALYLAEQLLGSPLVHATGDQAALVHPYPAGDTAIVLARHRNGAMTQATGAWSFPGWSRASAEIWGTTAAVRYDYWSEPDQIYLDAEGASEVIRVPGWSEELKSGYAASFREIADRFRAGAPAPWGPADAQRLMRIMHQVQSATARREKDGVGDRGSARR